MGNAEQITIRLQEMTSFIETAQAKLQKGEVVNLSHLDNEVAQLCDQTLKLPPQEASQVQPAMADMISKLEALGLALQEFQSNLKQGNS